MTKNCAAWLLLLATSCGRQDSPLPPLITTDSAGVELVTSSWPPEGVDQFQVITPPLLQIGSAEATRDEYLFSSIVSVQRLTDGRIAIADRAAHAVRIYDSTGHFLRSFGREGSGPGEFRGIALLAVFSADSLLVWDQLQFRGTIFGPGGEFVRHLTQPTFPGFFLPFLGMQDGTVLAFHGSPFIPPPAPATEAPQGTEVYRVNLSDASKTLLAIDSSPARRLTPTGWLPIRLHPMMRVGAFSGRIFIGNGERFEVRELDITGRLLRIVRVSRPALPVTEEMRELYKAALVKANSQSRALASFERHLAAAPFSDSLPQFDRIVGTADGRLWVRDYVLPYHDETQWVVFDSVGRLHSIVHLPSNFELHDAVGDRVNGWWLEPDAGPVVVSYQLTPAPRGGGRTPRGSHPQR